MKKTYITPVAESIRFSYRDQVVVASTPQCLSIWINMGDGSCKEGNERKEYLN